MTRAGEASIMRTMSLKAYELNILAQHLDGLQGQRVGKFIQYGKDVFSFRLQRGERVVISLDNQSPVVYLGGDETNKTSLATPASSLFRKRLSGAEYVGAETINEDRVLQLNFLAVNDIFETEPLSLVLELIPTKANMALLDANRRILFAFRPNSITDARPIFHGITYEPPLKKANFAQEEGDFAIEDYFRRCHEAERKMEQSRKNNLYQDFFRMINAKIKSLKHKIAQIDTDIEKGKKHLDDYQYGNYLFTYPESVQEGSASFDYYGERVALDPLKSPAENANEFFRRTKKAKNAIALGEENKKKALEELQENIQLKEFSSVCEEETLARLLDEHKQKKSSSKKSPSNPKHVKGPLPYVAKIGKDIFYFGKSAKQNDFLSFLYATKGGYLWFHVKDATGAHVILPYEHPSNPQIQHACEIALLASDRLDGEVQYTEHKNIRKGSVKGQVILSSYNSTYIREISNEALEAYEESLKKGGVNG